MRARPGAVLRSAGVRWTFLVLTLAAAAVALVQARVEVAAALAQLPGTAVVAACAASLVYLPVTLVAWRAVLRDLGSDIGWTSALAVFGPSQLGKYLPGGVWPLLAAGELGAAQCIPRRRSVSAMAVALLLAVASGVPVAAAGVLLGPDELRSTYGWVVVLVPMTAVALVPRVLNGVLAAVLRASGRPALDRPMSARGVATATGWSAVGWVVAGLQVWLLARPLGLTSPAGLALCVVGYALAWVVGFVVVVVPAGLGAREAVLAVVLGSHLQPGQVLAVVAVSRVLTTVTDVAFGIGGLALAGRLARRRDEAVP